MVCAIQLVALIALKMFSVHEPMAIETTKNLLSASQRTPSSRVMDWQVAIIFSLQVKDYDKRDQNMGLVVKGRLNWLFHYLRMVQITSFQIISV